MNERVVDTLQRLVSDPDISLERIADCDSQTLSPLGQWVHMIAIYGPKAVLVRKLSAG